MSRPTIEQIAHAEACAAELWALGKQLCDAVSVSPVDHARIDELFVLANSASERWHEALVAIGAFS